MRPSIIGYNSTQFGELWDKSLYQLLYESVQGLFDKTNRDIKEIDAIFYSNMLGGLLDNNLLSSGKIAELFHTHIPVYHYESACASGGMAFQQATMYLQANRDKNVLVIGAEKMTDVSPEKITEALISASSGEEQSAGLTFPGLYGMIANYYLQKYLYSSEVLSYVSVKNHFHGSLNAHAHFKKKVSFEMVEQSSLVADPLRVLHCSPISDGASALLLSNKKEYLGQVKILSSSLATDTISLKKRTSWDSLETTVIAGNQAFDIAGCDRKSIDVAEVHDCFSIAEIIAMEDLGFCKKGEGGTKAMEYATQLGKQERLVVNSSGGLKASGHPIGATGIKQIGELYLQLSGQAGERQVASAQYGLSHNVGGSGAVAVVSILGI
ncbi:MAG: beta-ketoacyl synthase N-terminal-like domain-containing protein [Candidatus Roizmanbacteria bacterium]